MVEIEAAEAKITLTFMPSFHVVNPTFPMMQLDSIFLPA